MDKMKKTEYKIAEESVKQFDRYWNLLIQEKPEYANDYLSKLGTSIIWHIAFASGYEYAEQEENILDKFGLN